MKVLLLALILVCIEEAGSSEPVYSEKQINLILNYQYKSNKSFPDILGIHFYQNKEGTVLQLEIESNLDNSKYIFDSMNALSKVGRFSKNSISKFIIIDHNKNLDVPISFESDANCAIKYFVKSEITKSTWMKDCLSNSITQRKIENWSNFKSE